MNKTRAMTLIAAMLSLLLLAGCGDSKDDEGPSGGVTPKLSGDIQLEAEKSGFNKSSVEAKPGQIKITVINPADSGAQHGVGIDGGTYKNVEGAPVKPGRSTSLTVAVKEGTYTIFDSYKNNRDKGFETKLVGKK